MRVRRLHLFAGLLSLLCCLLAAGARPAAASVGTNAAAPFHTIAHNTVAHADGSDRAHYLPARSLGATNVYTGNGPQPFLHPNGQVQQGTVPIIIYWSDPNRGFTFPNPTSITGYMNETTAWWDALHKTSFLPSSYYAGTVLSLATQFNGYYGPNSTPIVYSGEVYTPTLFYDAQSYPTSDCTDSLATAYCITLSDLQTEGARILAAYGIDPGLYPSINYDVVVMLPPNVGTCFDTSSASCAYTSFCAYHTLLTTQQGDSLPLMLAQPYPLDGSGNSYECGVPSTASPNGNLASDSAVNTLWHEYIESVSDPRGDGWVNNGNEVGDAYAWMFPSPIGSTTHGTYNAWLWDGSNGSGGNIYVVNTLQCVMRAVDGACALHS